MALVFSNNLNSNNVWLNRKNIPGIEEGEEGNYSFVSSVSSVFKKTVQINRTPIFDRTNKHPDVNVSTDYRSCQGTKAIYDPQLNNGIKTLPLEDNDGKVIFTIRIEETGEGLPMIGITDAEADVTTDIIADGCLWTLSEVSIKYYTNGKIVDFNPIIPEALPFKKDDILSVCIDTVASKIWVGLNGVWGIDRPGVIDSKTATLPYIKNIALYLIPSTYKFRLIRPKYIVPSSYSSAKSKPVLDWYLEK